MTQVIVFCEQSPFGCDLAGLLRPEAQLDALGWETDLEQAIRRIQKIQAPAVIVAQVEATDCGPAVTRLQAACPGIQITEVNLETRVVRIYGGEEHIVQNLKGLLSTIEVLCTTREDKHAT